MVKVKEVVNNKYIRQRVILLLMLLLVALPTITALVLPNNSSLILYVES